jgi:hypothetical protein
LFSRRSIHVPRSIAFVATILVPGIVYAQIEKQPSGRGARASANADGGSTVGRPPTSTTIHWQSVPLRDTLDRLRQTFQASIIVDRRVDPNERVTLDIEATSAEQALGGIADSCGLDVARLGKLLYLGPASASGRLRPLANLRTHDAAKLPADIRNAVLKRQPLEWPRLSEPRPLITSLVERNGWRVVDSEKIPHDLWAANELPDLNLAEQLTVLLLGFDLTFEFQSEDRTVRIVPLKANVAPAPAHNARSGSPTKIPAAQPVGGTKQVYTLHVQEKPVGAVLHELANRLHWNLRIDENAIRAAGKSLDQRVSFSVENADQDKLLEALLTPAGLEFRDEGEQILITPQRYGDK